MKRMKRGMSRASSMMMGVDVLTFLLFFTSVDIHPWWIWGYWISPLAYGENAVAVNEFTASRWQIVSECAPLETHRIGILLELFLDASKCKTKSSRTMKVTLKPCTK